MKRTTLFLLSIFVLFAGVFGFAQTADAQAGGSYSAPLFPTPSFSLDANHNQLTVTASGGSGSFRYFHSDCPSGPGMQVITGPYEMDHGSMSIGNVNASVSGGEITQTSAGEVGTPCEDPGSVGAFSTTKTLNVSGLSNGQHTLSVTMCTTNDSSKCTTRTADVTINRPATPPTLTGSCSASPNPAVTNQLVTWSATRSGGTGSYTYSWSGTDGLSGSTQNVTKTYGTTGTKNASVTITSGSQSITRNCSMTVGAQPPATHFLNVSKAGTGSGTVTSSPAGINCGSDCNEQYSEGTSVTLTADEDTGSEFVGWSGPGINCPGTGTCIVTMSDDRNVTATFNTAPPPGTCNITVQSQGLPTRWDVTGPGGTQSQTTNTYGPVTYNNMQAGTYTLVAADFAGYNKTISPSTSAVCSGGGSVNFIVNYSQQPRTLNVIVGGTGSGSVSSVPTGITCGMGSNDCFETYAQGTSVTLTRTIGANSTFVGWSGGGCSGTGATCTMTMNANKTVTATFNATTPPPGETHTLTVEKLGTGTGTVTGTGINCGSDCSETYNAGTPVTLTPTQGTGSVFAGWGGHADCADGQVTMNADKTCRATFNTEACGPGGGCPGGCTNPPDPQCEPSDPGGEFTCSVTSDTPASTNQPIMFEASGGVSP